MSAERPDLVLVTAPIGRDAEVMCDKLTVAGVHCDTAKNVDEVCERLPQGLAAIVATEEALPREEMRKLARALVAQPAWSEIPIVILTGMPSLETRVHSFEDLERRTNVTLVDRPVRIKSLISAVQSALRARERQYEVRDLMLQLEQRVNERDRFLAVLGHELRNPLGAILLAAQMHDADGRLSAEHAQLIERQTRHLTRLVNDLLDLSRVAAGKIVLKNEVIDIRDVAAEAVRAARPLAERQKLRLTLVECDSALHVEADPVRVDQIISNVLTNAIKYTPEGGHVKLALMRDGDHAIIQVTDDGVGIAPERISGIFELFAQAENAIGRAQGGMGIGLALVRNLVQLHGGAVSAKSDGVGKGSEFAVRLPLAAGVPARPPKQSLESSDGNGVGSEPRRIVIIEDNPDVRHLLRLKLSRLGHEVSEASDGHEGLKVLLDKRPDLALVDLGLPGIDGFQLAKEVRERMGDDVVLVAVSGFGRPEDKKRAIEAGFDEHVTKPADVRDIENILHRFPPRSAQA